MRYDIKEGTNFTKGFIYPPLCKSLSLEKRLIAFVSVNKILDCMAEDDR